MKNTNSLKSIVMVIMLFLVLSVAAGVFFTVRSANAPAEGENIPTETPKNQQTEHQSTPQPPEGEITEENRAEIQPTGAPTETAQPTATAQPTQAPERPHITAATMEMRAMWISYLEFQSVNFGSKSAFVKDMQQMFANCADMGLNTVIVQVRPFGDALYNSDIYPTSHLITGVQGDDLSFDPLAEMVQLAHAENLRIEAWVNPYRVRLHSKMPDNLSAGNPGNNADLVFSVDGGIYYNPCLEQVQNMVVNGIAEIVENYDVDGIHLDDYFYPSTDMSLDESHYKASGSSLSQADWRRENVNTLVRKIYKKIKSIDSGVTFGISPQGNNDNNYNVQYSDVNLWLANEGYVDYIMPQLYWGFGYLTGSGKDTYQFVKLSDSWAAYPRHSSVRLYIGLGAYRIGAGDGGANDQSEWSSGYNLMKQINALSANGGISGFALYRYDNLFKNSEYAALAQSEVAHITDIMV